VIVKVKQGENMPREPIEDILYRDLSIVAAKEYNKIASPLLMEIVNYGTRIFDMSIKSQSLELNIDAAATTLFLHNIELIDGIQVLLSASCVAPTTLLLRSIFEGLLALEYILEKDEFYRQRSLSWLYCYGKSRLDYYERLDPSTQRGKDFYEAKANDSIAKDLDLSDLIPISKHLRENMMSVINGDQMIPIDFEYQRTKKSKKRGGLIEWYQLFDGPVNIRGLATYLHNEAYYQVLYQPWSAITHGADLSRFVKRSMDNDPANRLIRSSDDFMLMASYSAIFGLRTIRIMTNKFCQQLSNEYRNWYLTEINEKLSSALNA
jgi:hypothetical protein